MRNLLVLIALTLPLCAQTPAPAKPVNPIPAILEAFRSHQLVAIGNVEFRGDVQSNAFQISLIRDPGFAAVANDIVVEFGNARHQDLMDRYIRGENVPRETLRQVWQDTTQIEYEWDLPIYENLFRTVRSLNETRPAARKLRVLLADPPIDWTNIHTRDELLSAMGDRDAHAVSVIRREVLAKNRRALLIFGGGHLVRQNTVPNAPDEWANGVIGRIEKEKLASTFVVLPETRRDLTTMQSDIASWPVPSLAILHDTALGAVLFDPRPGRRPVRLEDQVDALLYLGPPSSMTASTPTATLCADPKYMEMRLFRLNLLPPPPNAPVIPATQLKNDCATSLSPSAR